MLATITIDNKVKPGTSKWELDTPALCVDLDKMEQNIAKMQSTLKVNGLASRPQAYPVCGRGRCRPEFFRRAGEAPTMSRQAPSLSS